MIIETAAAMAVGVPLGALTGMMPGMHLNTLVALILPVSALLPFSPYFAVALIVTILTTHMFVNFVPSIMLGAPDSDTALSVMPGHAMLLEGRGLEAVRITVAGSMVSLIAAMALLFALGWAFARLYEFSRPFIHVVLVAVVLHMIASEKTREKIVAASAVFLLSGLFGLLVLDGNVIPQQYALFPMLAGLFGASTVAMSIGARTRIPKQEPGASVPTGAMMRPAVIGTIAGVAVGLLPGIGVSQAAVIGQQLIGGGSAGQLLFAVSAVNAADSVFSMGALYLVGNPRSGASVAVEQLLGQVSAYDIAYILAIMLAVSGVAAVVTLLLASRLASLMQRVNYGKLSAATLLMLAALVFAFTGLPGMLVFATGTSIGLFALLAGVRRSHAMGVLLLPTILFFSGLSAAVAGLLGI